VPSSRFCCVFLGKGKGKESVAEKKDSNNISSPGGRERRKEGRRRSVFILRIPLEKLKVRGKGGEKKSPAQFASFARGPGERGDMTTLTSLRPGRGELNPRGRKGRGGIPLFFY